MKFTFTLFLSELKRSLFFLPRIFVCAAVLFVFLGAVMFFGTKPAENDMRVKVLCYNPDNDTYIDMLINMVSEMDSVKSICTFEKTDSEQSVYDGIRSGKYYGGIIFPKDYIQGITDGTNEPAKVIVPRGGDNEVFRQLVSVGSDMLVSVQAGIYAAADGKSLSRTQIIGINLEYINFVLGRSKLFERVSWSPYGTLSLAQYYCIMALSLLSLLIGTALSFLFYEYSEGFKSYCRLWGYNGVFMLLLKQTLVFGITAAVTLPAAMLADKYIPVINFNYPMLFAGIFIASQTVTCFYTVFGGSAVVLLAGFTAVTGFFSGCFVPLVYLTESGLDKFCGLMPVYKITQCFSTLYTYRAGNVNILPMVLRIY
ncbi:MAG: ABC transporter permease, partial [Firmicutes bacterium]|nr:ABC transporter permease [Bacillota bacterium]